MQDKNFKKMDELIANSILPELAEDLDLDYDNLLYMMEHERPTLMYLMIKKRMFKK